MADILAMAAASPATCAAWQVFAFRGSRLSVRRSSRQVLVGPDGTEIDLTPPDRAPVADDGRVV